MLTMWDANASSKSCQMSAKNQRHRSSPPDKLPRLDAGGHVKIDRGVLPHYLTEICAEEPVVEARRRHPGGRQTIIQRISSVDRSRQETVEPVVARAGKGVGRGSQKYARACREAAIIRKLKPLLRRL